MKRFTQAICVGFLLVGTASIADTSADDAIKYRKNLMNGVKTSVNALIAVVKGEVDQQDQIESLANTFAATTAASMTKGGFMQNTHDKGDEEKTTATEKVWSEWDDFAEAFDKLDTAAKEIQAQAAAGTLTSFDQIKPALAQCGYCHRKAGFRTKK